MATRPTYSASARPRVATQQPSQAGEWRRKMATAGALNFLVGLWLIISPFALGYDRGDPFWNPIVFGALVALLGLIRATGAGRATWLSWINVVAGIWLFVSGFWLADFPLARLNLWVFGLAVFMLALVSIGASEEGARDETSL